MLTIRGTVASQPTTLPVCIPHADCPPPLRLVPEMNPHGRASWLPVPPEYHRPKPAWNELHYPVWGASRYAELNVLLTGGDWATLKADAGATRRALVSWDDEAGGTGSLPVRIVDAVPVSDGRAVPVGDAGDETVLWQVALSDYRWEASPRTIDETATISHTTWGDLLSALAALAGLTGVQSASAINTLVTDAGSDPYDAPTSLWGAGELKCLPVSYVLDAAACSVGLRLLFKPDGTATFQSHITAVTALTLPLADLHSGGFLRRRDGTATLFNGVQYDHTGVVAVRQVSVPAGVTGQVTQWLPHSSTAAYDRAANDYKSWIEPDVPDMLFAGYVPFVESALIDRYVLRHDDGITEMSVEQGAYPWPIVGQSSPTIFGGTGSDGVITLCVVKNGSGYVTDIRLTQRTEGVIRCVDAPECPPCSPPPPPATTGIIIGEARFDAGGGPVTGRTVTLTGATSGSTATDSGGAYTFNPVNTGANTVTLSLTGGETCEYMVDGAGRVPGNAAPVTVAAGVVHTVRFFVIPPLPPPPPPPPPPP